jgi:hypothetical protein
MEVQHGAGRARSGNDRCGGGRNGLRIGRHLRSCQRWFGAGQSGGVCIGRHPNASVVWYTGACSGHDEPELDPVSSVPGSARDLTWTAILPSDGSMPVSAVGPTFWWGGAVTDPIRTRCSARLSSSCSSTLTRS